MRSLTLFSLLLYLLQAGSFASKDQRDGPQWLDVARGRHYVETDAAAFDSHSSSSAREQPRTRKVAIIGAGPSGTSAAYFLKQAQARLRTGNFSTDNIDVTIYERETRIGGRTAVVWPYDDKTKDPIELGASIFAEVNLNIRRAVQEFGLETGAHAGMSGQMGIWDGQQFLFEGDQSSWWTSAKFFLRYGYSAIATETIVKKQLAYFSGLYFPSFLHSRRDEQETYSGYPWKSVEDLASAVNASDLAATTGMQFFKDRRVSELFIEEMVEAATRVNYAQDTDRIHGFGALVSLAASGADGVKAGNYRIFEEFARRSGARVFTGVEGTVTGIVKLTSSATSSTHDSQIPLKPEAEAEQVEYYIGTKSGEGEVYDAVIIATPWHNADITLLNTKARVKGKPFVHLHVTLLTTSTASPKPEYFGLGKQDEVPRTILTSDESVRRASEKGKPTPPGEPAPGEPGNAPPWAGAQEAAKKLNLEFFSLNYLRSVEPPSSPGKRSENSDKEYVVKIFSAQPISDSLLDSLFGLSSVSWVHRHEWDSYPYLTPTSRFPAIEVDENLFYPNAMESLVSTMETSTVSAKNTVGLLLNKWYGQDVVNGKDCRFKVGDEIKDPMQNQNWAGWGCDSG